MTALAGSSASTGGSPTGESLPDLFLDACPSAATWSTPCTTTSAGAFVAFDYETGARCELLFGLAEVSASGLAVMGEKTAPRP